MMMYKKKTQHQLVSHLGVFILTLNFVFRVRYSVLYTRGTGFNCSANVVRQFTTPVVLLFDIDRP